MSRLMMKSDEARTKMRDILDEVTAGREVVIARYNKPTAVVVNYAQWQAWKRERKERRNRLRKGMDDGDYATQGEVDAGLREQGLL